MNSDEVLRRTKEGMIESNKVLIRELVRDLEGRGIPIVVGVDGKVKKLKSLQALRESIKITK